jgi:hypothetical protein
MRCAIGRNGPVASVCSGEPRERTRRPHHPCLELGAPSGRYRSPLPSSSLCSPNRADSQALGIPDILRGIVKEVDRRRSLPKRDRGSAVNSTLNMSLAKDPSQMMYRAVGTVEL